MAPVPGIPTGKQLKEIVEDLRKMTEEFERDERNLAKGRVSPSCRTPFLVLICHDAATGIYGWTAEEKGQAIQAS